MAKAGLLGRVAAAAYNLTRGGAPRARVIHTYHGHVLEGYFSPLMTELFITLERLLARVSDRIVAISPAIERELRDGFGIGRAAQYRVVPLGFDLSEFAAIDDAARAERAQASRGRDQCRGRQHRWPPDGDQAAPPVPRRDRRGVAHPAAAAGADCR